MNPIAGLKPRTVNLMADLARKLPHKNYTENLTVPQHHARVMWLTTTLRVENSLVQHHEFVVLQRNNRGIALTQVAVL
jgi:hypothetical protein